MPCVLLIAIEESAGLRVVKIGSRSRPSPESARPETHSVKIKGPASLELGTHILMKQ